MAWYNLSPGAARQRCAASGEPACEVGVELHSYFSQNAQAAIRAAGLAAERLRNPAVEAEHLLLGLLEQPGHSARRMLGELGADNAALAAGLRARLQPWDGESGGTAQFAPSMLEVLDAAFRHMQELRHPVIGSAHLLLACGQSPSPLVQELCAAQGWNPQRLRAACGLALGHCAPAEAPAEVEEATPAEAGEAVAREPEAEATEAGSMELYNYFSFSAKKAIYRASEICQNFNNPLVEPEHVFFSILQLRSCSAVQVLNHMNVNLPKLTYALEAALYERAGNFKGSPQFSARTLALLDTSFREVKRLGHREIGTSHLLIALAQERHPALRDILEEARLDAVRVREAFVKHLGSIGPGHSAAPQADEPARIDETEQAAGWPPDLDQEVKFGVMSFVPGQAFSGRALGLLAGAVQLARVMRQPRTTPVELLAALLLGVSNPPLSLTNAITEADAAGLFVRISAHWLACGQAGPSPEPSTPPFSSALADLLGRAFSNALQEPAIRGRSQSVSSLHLLRALLDEPTAPVAEWLAAVQRWRERETQIQVQETVVSAAEEAQAEAASAPAPAAEAEAGAGAAPPETPPDEGSPDAPAAGTPAE
jgi:ATP-dependent Clp protease ATP-binding subunit ClpA